MQHVDCSESTINAAQGGARMAYFKRLQSRGLIHSRAAAHNEEDAEEDVAHDYINTARSFNKYQRERKERLPVKTMDGLVHQVEAESEEDGNESEEESGGAREGVDLEDGVNKWLERSGMLFGVASSKYLY